MGSGSEMISLYSLCSSDRQSHIRILRLFRLVLRREQGLQESQIRLQIVSLLTGMVRQNLSGSHTPKTELTCEQYLPQRAIELFGRHTTFSTMGSSLRNYSLDDVELRNRIVSP